MKVGKLIGWVLLAGAFAFAAAETAAQGIAKQPGFLLSAYTVLHTLIPGELIQTRIVIQKNIHPALWDYFILAVLWFPGWLTLGLPGIYLAWKFRDRPEGGDDEDDGILISSYDDILAAAEEADEYDDSPPSKYEHLDEFDPTKEQHEEDGIGTFELEPEHLADPKKE